MAEVSSKAFPNGSGPYSPGLNGMSAALDRVARQARTRRRYGDPIADAEEPPRCDVCDGRRMYLVGGELVHCPCGETPERKARRHQALLRYGQLDGSAFQHMKLDTFVIAPGRRDDMVPEFMAVVNWASNPDGFLYIAGDPGTGKTHLAVAVAHERIAQGDVVYYTTVSDLGDVLRASSFDGDGSYYRIMESLTSVDLLVLDDLGKERRNAFIEEKLHQVVVGREKAGMPTVVTTHLGTDQLKRERPDLAWRLLSEFSSTSVVLVGSNDRSGGE